MKSLLPSLFECIRLRGGAKRARESAKDEESEDSDIKRRKQIPESGDGKGIKMMKQMGYHGGGLGAKGQGIHEAVEMNPTQQRMGLGSGSGNRQQNKLTRDDFLFSDSSDMADTHMFGPGQFSLKRKMDWKHRVDKALGIEKVRKRKDATRILDPDDDNALKEFETQFDAKYGSPSEVEESIEVSKIPSNRTDWKSMDRITRKRTGLRGCGEAKQAVSSQQRKKDRKANIFNLRTRYRVQEEEGEEAVSDDEIFRRRDEKSQVQGEFFDPRVPRLDDLSDYQESGCASDLFNMGSGAHKDECASQDVQGRFGLQVDHMTVPLKGELIHTEGGKLPYLPNGGVPRTAHEAARQDVHSQARRKGTFDLVVTRSSTGHAETIAGATKHPPLLSTLCGGVARKSNIDSLSNGVGLQVQAAAILAELRPTVPYPAVSADRFKTERKHIEKLAVGTVEAGGQLLGSGAVAGAELSGTLLAHAQTRANFRDDAGAVRELLEQPDDGPQRTSPRGGWIRWARAQVRPIRGATSSLHGAAGESRPGEKCG